MSRSVSECLGVSRIVSRSDMECLGVCLGVTWSVTLEYHGALWSEWSDSDPDLADATRFACYYQFAAKI